jgi:hypothetical protein
VSQKIKTALPPHLDLGGSWVVEWDAVDPTTGASVPGVVISATALQVEGSPAALAAVGNPILLAVGSG